MLNIMSMAKLAVSGAIVFLALAFAPALALGTGSAPEAARAQISIDDFFGHWTGSGIAEIEKKDASWLALSERARRELEVDIKAAGDGGFEITWLTQQMSNSKMNQPGELKTSTLVLMPKGEGQWRAKDGDPELGGRLAWASLEGNNLLVRTFTVQEDGRAENQIYRRTMTGGAMELFYRRSVDGETVRTASGRLTRQNGK